MPIKRIIIACLLLATYTLGFAHNLIPHCNAACADVAVDIHDAQGHHHHDHHEHDHDEMADHDHIAHNDHLDGGLVDYVICLLSEMEHGSIDCQPELALPTITTNSIPDASVTVMCGALLHAVLAVAEQDEPLPLFGLVPVTTFTAPPIPECPHRGPPFLSC